MTKDTTSHDDEPATASTPSRVDDGDIAALEQQLRERGVAFARATVVRREPPVSANVGDRAIVTAEGDLYGWVGGAACAQTVVKTQAKNVLESGQPTLVGIAPDPERLARPGLETFPMTCHSDGVLEVFIEPVAPTTSLVLVGDEPITQSLARLAGELSLSVTLVAPQEGEFDVPAGTEVLVSVDPEELAATMGPDPLVVVASMGEFDARGIAAGVLADARYLGLVASDERASAEIDRAAGLLGRDPEAVRSAVTNPAGVDIVARSPAEIAAAILAELVDVRSTRGSAAAEDTSAGSPSERTPVETTSERTSDEPVSARTPDEATRERDSAETEESTVDEFGDHAGEIYPAEAIDPVCGMTVDTDDPPATVEYDDEPYYFCCHGCADSFRTAPETHLDGNVEASP
jgi:xanthine dehydrogenase accessory factor